MASVGCALTNYLGNEAIDLEDSLYHLGAVGTGVATLAFIWLVLKPFDNQD